MLRCLLHLLAATVAAWPAAIAVHMGGHVVLRLALAGRDLVELAVVPAEVSYIKLDYDTDMKAAAAICQGSGVVHRIGP